jgi:hypothetical protein
MKFHYIGHGIFFVFLLHKGDISIGRFIIVVMIFFHLKKIFLNNWAYGAYKFPLQCHGSFFNIFRT